MKLIVSSPHFTLPVLARLLYEVGLGLKYEHDPAWFPPKKNKSDQE